MSSAPNTSSNEPPLVARWFHVGGAGPPLVYVPGIDGSGELLLETRARLEESFRLGCLRYELRAAEHPAAAYAGLARSIVERLDDEGFERPLVLAESFGVAVALRLALDFPERVRALMLVNGFARFPNRKRLVLSRRLTRFLPASLFRLGRRFVAPHVLFSPRKDAAALRAFRALTRLQFDAGYRFRMAMIERVDFLDELDRITCPTAVFAADSDRVVPSIRTGREIVERIPGATLQVLEHAGHLVLPLPEEPWTERLSALASPGS